MELTTVILIFLILIALFKCFRNNRTTQLINKLPGPPTVPILGNALQFVGVARTDRMKVVMERDLIYGPIYRNWLISQPYVHICSPELAEVVLNLKDLKKGQVYTFLRPWFGNGLLTADGADWARSRKMITPIFHFKVLERYLEIFNENALALVKKLREMSVTRESFDVYPLITLSLLDTINEAAMGNKINALKKSDTEYVKATYEMLKLVFYRYDRPWLHSDFIYRLTPAAKKAKKTLKILNDFTEKTIQKRLTERAELKSKRVTFLDLLLDNIELQNTEYSLQQLREEVNTFMFEGHDTSSAALGFTMLMLSVKPELQEEIYKEQLALQCDRENWFPSMQDLNEMKLMDRFIKETMRLHPPIPFISRTLTKDVEIGGYVIPAGSVALISMVSILRDPKHFPQPEKFDPDRFLLENSVGRSAFAYIPFSAGPRNCIGQRFAMANVKMFLSHIVRNFRILPVENPEDLKTIIEVVQKPFTTMQLILLERNVK